MQIHNMIEIHNILWYYLHMEYKLIRSYRKTLSIKISPNGEVIVHSPNKCSLKFIENFLKSKLNWITEKQQERQDNLTKFMPYINMEKILLLGTCYLVLDFKDHYEVGGFYIKHSKTNNKKKVLKEFLLKRANQYIFDRVAYLSNLLNLKYNDIKIMSAKHVWGSCNNLKQLKFNFKLIMLPQKLIDYVICHELCHTKQLNHSKEFWQLLDRLGYKKTEVKQNFKEYNFVLQLF